MLNATVQSAFVVIVAWLISLATKYAGFPLDDVTIASVASVIVAYIISKIAAPATVSTVRSLFISK